MAPWSAAEKLAVVGQGALVVLFIITVPGNTVFKIARVVPPISLFVYKGPIKYDR